MGFKKLTVLQYTHWESFLPAKIKLNILTSQFHRYIRLITCEGVFHVEVAIVLVKLTVACGMPREPLLRTLRRMPYAPATRYVRGDSPHRPGFHLERIMRWVSFGERHGVQKLVSQLESQLAAHDWGQTQRHWVTRVKARTEAAARDDSAALTETGAAMEE
jgi:hypothetical protein